MISIIDLSFLYILFLIMVVRVVFKSKLTRSKSYSSDNLINLNNFPGVE